MAISIDLYSTQVTEQNAVAHTPSMPNELGGRVRLAYGTYETPATTGVTDGQNIAMTRLPAGARVVRITTYNDAMGTGAQVDLGVAGVDGSGYYDADESLADDDDLFGAAVDIAAAGTDSAANTVTTCGLTFDKEVYVVATAENANWDAEKTFTIFVEYVVD